MRNILYIIVYLSKLLYLMENIFLDRCDIFYYRGDCYGDEFR